MSEPYQSDGVHRVFKATRVPIWPGRIETALRAGVWLSFALAAVGCLGTTAFKWFSVEPYVLALGPIAMLVALGGWGLVGATRPVPVTIRLGPVRLSVDDTSIALDDMKRVRWLDRGLELDMRSGETQILDINAPEAVRRALRLMVNQDLHERGTPRDIPAAVQALRDQAPTDH